MSLRTRIAVIFLALLSAVLVAALLAVSMANRRNAEGFVREQLKFGDSTLNSLLQSNRRLLTQEANSLAQDFGFRETLAEDHAATLVSALQNLGERAHARMAVLTALDGSVKAAYGSQMRRFPLAAFEADVDARTDHAHLMVDDGRIYQVVAVPVKSPLTVAWLVLGFELDAAAAQELAKETGLGVELSFMNAGQPVVVASSAPTPNEDPGTAARGSGDLVSQRIVLPSLDATPIHATLSRPLADALQPFQALTETLVKIAVLSLLVFCWAAFWIARSITRPLHVLSDAVDQVRNGSYGVPFRIGRRDEIGVLAEGLQLMQTAVMSRDQSIRRLAYEDALTGLMNRTAFNSALGESLAGSRDRQTAVAAINLQRFRRINEHLGYSVGDSVLRVVAARLSSVPGMNSAVARLAGDRFAAFTRLRDGEELPAWGASLLAALSEPVLVEAQPIDVSAAVGLIATAGGAGAEDLLRAAELALEQARGEKRALAVYDPARIPSAPDQLSLLGELRQALERDELRLFYQPKIELATSRVAGAEVLLRWQHPQRGLLAPGAFLPFAEQTGYIRQITRWTLDHALAQAALWERAGNPLPLAVNISADDLGDPRFDSRVARLLTRHAVSPSLLTLELTESGFIDDPARALRMLESLAALGIHLSIDDFGTGYSSLSHLARMPVHEVKIDRSFVLGMESDAEYATVVRSAIDMGHSLGLKVVVEGIENAASGERLRALGCDVAQGYWYAKPMPLEALEAWLAGKARVPVVATAIEFEILDLTDTVTLATY